MLKIYQTIDQQLHELFDRAEIDKGVWIHSVSPDKQEIDFLVEHLGIELDVINYALDENERARIEQEDNYTLLIINYPLLIPGSYDTHTLGIILTDKAVVSITARETPFIQEFTTGRIKGFETQKKGRFVLQLFYRIAALFMTYLRQMSQRLDLVEDELKNTTKNEALLKLLDLNNSLVYFSTALRANYAMQGKLSRLQPFRIYEEDREILEDTMVETQQGIDMTGIYINILSSTMDAYASIISNNLSTVMKFLTAWTIVIMIPSFVTSLYGMNVKLPLEDHPWAFLFILLFCFSMAGGILLLIRRKFF